MQNDKVKMLVTDLDRTLLRSDKRISAYTVDVLCRCQASGIRVVYATARPQRTAAHFCDDVYPDALIVHNGAAVFIGGQLFSHCAIAPDIARQLLLAYSLDFPGTALSVEIDDVLYANFDVSALWENVESVRSNFTDLPDKPAEKIIIGISAQEEIGKYAKYLPAHLYIEMNEGRLGLIMSKNATKLTAVKALARHFGYEMSGIAAFGDDTNDLGMIRECGLGIAMGNALQEVKAVANHICETNDNDDAAKWIEENILL